MYSLKENYAWQAISKRIMNLLLISVELESGKLVWIFLKFNPNCLSPRVGIREISV